MKLDTLMNLFLIAIWAILGITALIAAVLYAAYWLFFAVVACLVFVYVLWKDDAYGVESVEHYFEKLARAKRTR